MQLYFNSLIAQTINEQFEIVLENDKFVLIDRYYTNGLFLSYKKRIENDFIYKNNADLQLNFTLGNEIYTPLNLSSLDTRDFDRPFAGWLFGKIEVAKVTDKFASSLALETGVTGRESFSNRLQTWFHKALRIEEFISWTEEIEFKLLFNIKYNHFYDLPLNENNIFQYRILSTIGTKDIFLENNVYYFFGEMNNLKNSSRVSAIDITNTKEFYGFATLGYKYVVHNTLIEGGLLKDDILFTTSATNHIFKLKVGGVYKKNRSTFKLIYNFNSKETPQSISHSFVTLSFSQDF